MWQVLSFRLDRFSEDGRPLPSIPVEMRRLHLHGSVSEGETVEVRGKWHPGELLEVKRIRNISAGGTVYGKGRAHPVLKVFGAILVLAVIAGIGVLIIELASHSQQGISNGAAVPFMLVTPHARRITLAVRSRLHGSRLGRAARWLRSTPDVRPRGS